MAPSPLLLLLSSYWIFCLCFGITLTKSTSPLQVTLANGSPVDGVYRTSHTGRGIRAFKNIPYAEAPLNSLRFSDPQPKLPWTADYKLPGADENILCPQIESLFSNGVLMGQEDCLYLHVYAPLHPKDEQELLPVMVFYHGGGFISGAALESMYGPEFLLDKDVILVAGNYRLGPLGFLSTFTSEFPGNYGMKDQVMILKWIQSNIALFGGDPKRVTIFGESAGGSSVGYHLMSPMSKGLFSQGIQQSGTAFEAWANVSRAQSLYFSTRVFDELKCPYEKNNYQKTLECMRKMDAGEVAKSTAVLFDISPNPIVNFCPVLEVGSKHPFMTEEIFNDVNAGSEIPVMVGMTNNDGAFLTAMLIADPKAAAEVEWNFDQHIGPFSYFYDTFDSETWPQKLKILKQYYFKGEAFQLTKHVREISRLFTDMIFKVGLNQMLKRRVKTARKVDTFVYNFNYRGDSTFSNLFLKNATRDLGVSHVDDLFYLFPFVKNVLLGHVMSLDDEVMRTQMVEMWTNFAATGNPSASETKFLPIKDHFPIDYMQIGDCNAERCGKEKTALEMKTGLFEADFEFLEAFFK